MTELLLHPEELAAMARAPRSCVADAAARSPEAVRAEASHWEHRYRRGLKGLAAWTEGTVEALAALDRGPRAVADLLGAGSWRVAAANGVTAADLAVLELRHGDAVAQALLDGGADAALSVYDAVEGSFGRLHDARVDLVSAAWTALLELGGREALERCLRDLADASLLRWMATDVTLPVIERLQEWSAVMRANFTTIAISEDADGFTITSDPCGSCTRQLVDGRADALGLALVDPFGPEHVGTDPVPVYRSHVGLMHWLMPTERIGRPWPIVRCPHGAGTGPCSLTIAKAP